MTLLDIALLLLLAPVLILVVRRVFRFVDESSQYQVELKELRDLGLAEVHGRPVRQWIRRLYVSPHAVRQYRRLRR
jgi:hypothetical protein